MMKLPYQIPDKDGFKRQIISIGLNAPDYLEKTITLRVLVKYLNQDGTKPLIEIKKTKTPYLEPFWIEFTADETVKVDLDGNYQPEMIPNPDYDGGVIIPSTIENPNAKMGESTYFWDIIAHAPYPLWTIFEGQIQKQIALGRL